MKLMLHFVMALSFLFLGYFVRKYVFMWESKADIDPERIFSNKINFTIRSMFLENFSKFVSSLMTFDKFGANFFNGDEVHFDYHRVTLKDVFRKAVLASRKRVIWNDWILFGFEDKVVVAFKDRSYNLFRGDDWAVTYNKLYIMKMSTEGSGVVEVYNNGFVKVNVIPFVKVKKPRLFSNSQKVFVVGDNKVFDVVAGSYYNLPKIGEFWAGNAIYLLKSGREYYYSYNGSKWRKIEGKLSEYRIFLTSENLWFGLKERVLYFFEGKKSKKVVEGVRYLDNLFGILIFRGDDRSYYTLSPDGVLRKAAKIGIIDLKGNIYRL